MSGDLTRATGASGKDKLQAAIGVYLAMEVFPNIEAYTGFTHRSNPKKRDDPKGTYVEGFSVGAQGTFWRK